MKGSFSSLTFRHGVLIGMMLIGVLTRFIPHPPNFTAVGAVSMIGAALWFYRRWALWIPLLILGISDLIWGAVSPEKGWYAGQAFVYVGFLAYPLVGFAWLRGHQWSMGRVALSALTASFLFFVVSNLGVWWLGGFYPHTSVGLFSAYVAALPFWVAQWAGDTFYGLLLAGAWMWAGRRFPG